MSLIKTFLAKSLSLPWLGKAWECGLCANLFEAGRSISYVETVGNKADTLHRYVSFSDENSIKRAYEGQIRKALKTLKIKSVELAIDGKKDLYYGDKGGLCVRGIKHEHGAEEAWEYVVISIIHPVKIPLMAVHYYQGADLAKCCIELLEYAKTLPFNIKRILFDRGFYNGHLIDYLESNKSGKSLPYLIFVPKNDAIKGYIAETQGSWKAFQHEIKYPKQKSTWKIKTNIVICKNVDTNKKGEPYDWAFATNLTPSFQLVRDYRRRWNIETGFRIMEEGKIKTKSNNHLIRLFYFFLRALFLVVWQLNKSVGIKITFKKFLRIIEMELRQYEVYKPPEIMPLY